MLGIWVFMATKKAPYKGAFDVYNCLFDSYCPPPVLRVPIVLATAVPIPVPCGVWIALSYLTDIVIVAGSELVYANVL
jgi:hypothetical protein